MTENVKNYLKTHYHAHNGKNRYDKIKSSSDGFNISRVNRFGKRSIAYFKNDGSPDVSSSNVHKTVWMTCRKNRIIATLEYDTKKNLINHEI